MWADADGTPRDAGGVADPSDALGVDEVVAVVHVQPSDVHACIDKVDQGLGRVGSRADGAHNLRSTHT